MMSDKWGIASLCGPIVAVMLICCVSEGIGELQYYGTSRYPGTIGTRPKRRVAQITTARNTGMETAVLRRLFEQIAAEDGRLQGSHRTKTIWATRRKVWRKLAGGRSIAQERASNRRYAKAFITEDDEEMDVAMNRSRYAIGDQEFIEMKELGLL
jgi:hypothetical protein